ncbi:hypothetical protein [Anditalea andensis]|uniref:Peptidase S33 tripeptidyl aminopeptidase-like C-terminal domain-containing protein n=1 Tax=Anditalea andensis TaxID=1048983 RepID=A0A074L0S0_9BACT|nr:hypothetical protein [Anditalea andensis]KEO74749.1 hypothetical protein EL17_03470 [Anditalea andensis]
MFTPLQPDPYKIITAAQDFQTPIMLVTGTFDNMITSKNLSQFSSKLSQIQNIALSFGHNTLIEETINYFKKK